MYINPFLPSISSHYLPSLDLGEVTKFTADGVVPQIVDDLEQETIIKRCGVCVFPLLHTEVENLPVEIKISRCDA